MVAPNAPVSDNVIAWGNDTANVGVAQELAGVVGRHFFFLPTKQNQKTTKSLS